MCRLDLCPHGVGHTLRGGEAPVIPPPDTKSPPLSCDQPFIYSRGGGAWEDSAAPLFSLSTSFSAQSCVHESDLRSTNTLSLVSTIPRIKRIGVKLFHSNDTAFVYITFLGSVATPVVWAIKSLILCLHDWASYPSLGPLWLALRLFQLDFSSALYLRLLHSGIFFVSQKGVELSSGVSRHLVKTRRSQSLDVFFNTSLHPDQSHH